MHLQYMYIHSSKRKFHVGTGVCFSTEGLVREMGPYSWVASSAAVATSSTFWGAGTAGLDQPPIISHTTKMLPSFAVSFSFSSSAILLHKEYTVRTSKTIVFYWNFRSRASMEQTVQGPGETNQFEPHSCVARTSWGVSEEPVGQCVCVCSEWWSSRFSLQTTGVY